MLVAYPGFIPYIDMAAGRVNGVSREDDIPKARSTTARANRKMGQGPISLRDKPLANPAVVLREDFEDWAVLFDPDTAEVAGLSATGVSIWKLLDGTRSIRQIAAELRRRFENAPRDADSYVEAFVVELSERGFVAREVEDFRDPKGDHR